MAKFKNIRKQLDELNGQTGPVLRISYRPQKANIGKGLTSHSTIDKSDLYNDIVYNNRNWKITANTNSLAFRLPHPKGREDDRADFMGLLKKAIPGKTGNLIRGGGFTESEVQELKRDYEKAIKAFKGDTVVSQDHEIYVAADKPGGLNVKAGLLAMLKALDEFGMRNHISLSSRDGVLTQIQDAGQYNRLDEGLFTPAKKAPYKFKGKVKPFSPLQKKRLMKHYGDIIKGKPGAIQKVQDILKDDVNEEVINEKMTAAQKKKRYEMIKKAVEKINARNLKRAKADALKMMKSSGMFDEEKELEEKGPGLWANIHKRRKSGKRMRKKGEKGAPTAAAMRQAKGESVNEDSFKLVDMSRKTAKIADKLAQKVGLDTDLEGGVLGIQLTVHGTKKKIEKWLQSLPLEEGMYTRDDGGAYDGLRIAKYLAYQDGKPWRNLPYGTLQGYLDTAMDMLKRDKSKARDILSKPTPRGY